ncbi:MAG: dephospho-CoA kinase [Bacteroidales bacterium]|nr:dephospho-CoA kinase [Bacteroidales bacterium]
MFCFACTGGIGSGKSYVIRIFSAIGIPAFIADERVKELYNTDSELLGRLVELLGEEILKDGILQKHIMAKKIFSDRNVLERVNGIVHPRLLEDFYEWRECRRKEGNEIIIYESAIFFETPLFWTVADKVIVVVAPEHIRIGRVMKRDGVSEEQVRARILSQWNDKMRISMADYIIHADGRRAVLPQVLEIVNSVKVNN